MHPSPLRKRFFSSVRTGAGVMFMFSLFSAVAQPQLLMHLKLDEQPAQNSTGLIDSSGNGNHGTVINNNPGTDKSVPGVNRWALRFDGTSDRVDAAAFDIEDTFTIAFWVNPATTADGQAFVGKHYAAGGNQIVVGFYSGYHFRIRGVTFQAGTPQSGWQHIAVVAEATGTGSTEVTFYRDAIPLWTSTFAAVAGNTGGGRAWTLGQEWDTGPTPGDFLTGDMDDVAIWNGALTPAEIEHLVNGSTVNVTTTTDVIDAADGLTSLREAVIQANQMPGPNGIILPAGTYRLTSAGPEEDAAATGDLDSTDTFGTLTFAGAGRDATFIDGDDFTRMLELHRHTDTVINGVTFQNGRTDEANGGGSAGVQLWPSTSLAMTNVRFVNNHSATSGGALLCLGSTFIEGTPEVQLLEVIFQENRGQRGGAMIMEGNATLRNVQFVGNHALVGGACELRGFFNEASFFNCLFVGNAAAISGGAVNRDLDTKCHLINSTLVGNVAQDSGGALYHADSIDGTLSLHNSIMWGNALFNGAPSQIAGEPLDSSFSNLIEGNPGDPPPFFVRNPDPGDGNWLTPGDNDYGNLQPRANSPSVNAGSNGLLPVGLLTDLDGAPRIRQGKVDIGAYEHQVPGFFRVDQAAPGPEEDGLSWESAFTNLQTALAIAQAGDEIWLKSGTYRPAAPGAHPQAATSSFVLKEDVDIYGGFAGTETQRDQRNPDPASNGTILSGDFNGDDDGSEASAYDNSQHVVRANHLSSATLLSGVTIRDGWARDLAHLSPGLPIRSPDRGAGLYDVGSSLRLEDVRFVGNRAGQGAGIYSEMGGALSLTRVVFLGNSAASELTGFSVGGGMVSKGNPRMVDVVFRLNDAASLGGGLFLHGPGPDARLERVTFDENYADSGGGFYNAGNPTLIDGLFTKNRCRNIGGGMLNAGDPLLEGVSFTLNNTQFSVQSGEGRGGGFASSAGAPVLRDVTFENNTATSDGGALYLGGGSLLHQGGSYANNRATDPQNASGGAIETEAGSDYVVRDVVFSSNSVPGGLNSGGAIYQEGTGIMMESQFYDNTSTGSAGAIFSNNDLTIVNCVFERNSTKLWGGALFLPPGANLNLLIANCVFSGNSAREFGGGAIYLGSGSATIRNTTLAGNYATFEPGFLAGGAILIQDGTLDLANSIVWQNEDPTGIGTPSAAIAHGSGGAGSASVAATIVQGSGGSGASWATTLGTDGGGNLDVDPLFVTPVDPSVLPSPSWDLRLRIGSSAHDAGVNASLPLDVADVDNDLNSAETLPLDLAGRPRVFGAAVDLGAFEGGYTTFALTHPGLDPEVDDNGNGHSNFADYSYGYDPLQVAGSGGPFEIWMAGGILQLRHTIRGNGADTAVRMLVSTDLEIWSPASNYSELSETTWPAGDLTWQEITHRFPGVQPYEFFKLDPGP